MKLREKPLSFTSLKSFNVNEQAQKFDIFFKLGEIPEWSKGAVCKTAGSTFAGSNPALATKKFAGIAQLARATAFQAVGCEFESRFPLHVFKLNVAGVAQLVEQLICNQ